MATLYRCRAPTDWLCPCGTTARALRRARIPFLEVRTTQRRGGRSEVRALTGQSRVPVVVLDGEAICDSHRIREHLAFRMDANAPAGADAETVL